MNEALKKAIYTTLSEALLTPVYDHVPQGSEYPYICLDTFTSNDADYLNSRKEQVSVYLSVWSDYRGQTEVMQIMAEIDAALHRKKLDMDTGRLVRVTVTSKETNREPDGVTYMGQVRLAALVEN